MHQAVDEFPAIRGLEGSLWGHRRIENQPITQALTSSRETFMRAIVLSDYTSIFHHATPLMHQHLLGTQCSGHSASRLQREGWPQHLAQASI